MIFWQLNIQESCAIAKTTARCTLYIAALKILHSPWLRPRPLVSKIFNSLLLGLSLRMFRPNLKFIALSVLVRAISFQDFQPMCSWSGNVTDRQTDRQTDDMQSQYRDLHCSASRGKNEPTKIRRVELVCCTGVGAYLSAVSTINWN